MQRQSVLCWTVLVFLALLGNATNNDFKVRPQDQIVVNGTRISATYYCKFPGFDHEWSVNEHPEREEGFLDMFNASIKDGHLTFHDVSQLFNNSVITCTVLTPTLSVHDSASAMLILQGPPPTITGLNFTCNSNNSYSLLSAMWNEPPMLNLTQPTNITYHITIATSNGTILLNISTSKMEIQLVNVPNSYESLFIKVIAINEAGSGDAETKKQQCQGAISITNATDVPTISTTHYMSIGVIITVVVVVAIVAIVAVVIFLCVCIKKLKKRKKHSNPRNGTYSPDMAGGHGCNAIELMNSEHQSLLDQMQDGTGSAVEGEHSQYGSTKSQNDSQEDLENITTSTYLNESTFTRDDQDVSSPQCNNSETDVKAEKSLQEHDQIDHQEDTTPDESTCTRDDQGNGCVKVDMESELPVGEGTPKQNAHTSEEAEPTSTGELVVTKMNVDHVNSTPNYNYGQSSIQDEVDYESDAFKNQPPPVENVMEEIKWSQTHDNSPSGLRRERKMAHKREEKSSEETERSDCLENPPHGEPIKFSIDAGGDTDTPNSTVEPNPNLGPELAKDARQKLVANTSGGGADQPDDNDQTNRPGVDDQTNCPDGNDQQDPTTDRNTAETS